LDRRVTVSTNVRWKCSQRISNPPPEQRPAADLPGAVASLFFLRKFLISFDNASMAT
jgi:hypothetical protein